MIKYLENRLNELIKTGETSNKKTITHNGDKVFIIYTNTKIGSLSGEKSFKIECYYKTINYFTYTFYVDIYSNDIEDYSYEIIEIEKLICLNLDSIIEIIKTKYNDLTKQVDELLIKQADAKRHLSILKQS